MTITDLLDLPGFFLCERGGCKMHVDDCLKRQRLREENPIQYERQFGFCADCEKGAENRIKEGDTMTDNMRDATTRGTGAGAMSGNHFVDADKMVAGAGESSRNGNHEQPADDPAAEQNTAGAPESSKADEPETQWARCKECGRRAIHPRSPLCAKCMAAKSRKKAAEKRAEKTAERIRQAERLGAVITGKGDTTEPATPGAAATDPPAPVPVATRQGDTTQPPAPVSMHGDHLPGAKKKVAGTVATRPPAPDPDTGDRVLSIRFDDYPEVLEGVKRLAGLEVRPIPHQVIYMLKSYIEASA